MNARLVEGGRGGIRNCICEGDLDRRGGKEKRMKSEEGKFDKGWIKIPLEQSVDQFIPYLSDFQTQISKSKTLRPTLPTASFLPTPLLIAPKIKINMHFSRKERGEGYPRAGLSGEVCLVGSFWFVFLWLNRGREEVESINGMRVYGGVLGGKGIYCLLLWIRT